MAIFSTDNPWAFAFGLLGNLISFVVFLTPVPTFYRVCKRNSTEGFQSVPYVVSLLSAMLWLYYASINSESNDFLLITVNSVGCVIETIYVALYLAYSPKKAKIFTVKLMVTGFGGFCSFLLLSGLLTKASTRVQLLGWLCVGFSVSVFAAPLSVMRMMIRTKSVEFMPCSLSFFLTLSAATWLLYGLFLKDIRVAVPNVLGFILGVFQMGLYLIYRKTNVMIIEMAENNQVPFNVPNDLGDVPMVDSTVAMEDVQPSGSKFVVANATGPWANTNFGGVGTSHTTGMPGTVFQNSVCQMAFGSISGGMVQRTLPTVMATPPITTNEKSEKFTGVGFKQWQQKIYGSP
ncbi:bidirectional sugar transporter SWEET12-like [Eucalyptus grandis]|uniref:bidirectional sugar transporter SWEET12-like n=1 Tax=Eucalyptus grandis TaxID=71139 RepID=UPI00192EBFF3|nr:bidirectional sugar transporter SWEET12-like [Eucalyptus grandis]